MRGKEDDDDDGDGMDGDAKGDAYENVGVVTLLGKMYVRVDMIM